MTTPRAPLFTASFFLMCAFSFTVFVSVFMLLPTMPYRILELGGSESAAGLFLGFLTYSSAFTAPLTGAVADRFGKRRMLVGCSLVLALFAVAYAVVPNWHVPLALALLHGLFWSGLLSASAANITDIVPAERRAEGIGYWGLSSVLATAIAPALGFRALRHGWVAVCAVVVVLNLLMAVIAWQMKERGERSTAPFRLREAVEWRVLALALTLFLYSYGYGAITSFVALYADACGVTPRSLFFTAFAVVVLVTRPFASPLGDRIGTRRVLVPCLVMICGGLALLALDGTQRGLLVSAVVFGTGFGTAYPVFAAHALRGIPATRRGAAFGSILAAFDTGIGSGSIVSGLVVERFGFRAAFGSAAVLCALSVPYFLMAERLLGTPPDPPA